MLPDGLPRIVHAYHSSNTEGTRMFLFFRGKKPFPQGGPLMPRKEKTVPVPLPARRRGSGPNVPARSPPGAHARTRSAWHTLTLTHILTQTSWRRCRMTATSRVGRPPRGLHRGRYHRYHQRGRAIEVMAPRLLERQGYSVLRSVRYTNGVHLVAWSDRVPPLFVHVRRVRKLIYATGEIPALWPGEVAALRAIPRWDGMSVQFWIFAGRTFGWQFFEVFPSGVKEVEGLVA